MVRLHNPPLQGSTEKKEQTQLFTIITNIGQEKRFQKINNNKKK